MNPQRSVLALALAVGMLAAACGASTGSAAPPTPVVPLSSGIALRAAPPDLGCDSIGWEGEPIRTLTFHVDPDATDPVWAVSDTGAVLTTYWSSGFQASEPPERLVRDPSGDVFVNDGEVVDVPQGANLYLHGYFVCMTPDKLYVLTKERG